MTKEQFRHSIFQFVYGSFKSMTEGTETQDQSDAIEQITNLIVEDSYSLYRPEHTEIIPSNFKTIWSYYHSAVDSFFQESKQSNYHSVKSTVSRGDLYHYLALTHLFESDDF